MLLTRTLAAVAITIAMVGFALQASADDERGRELYALCSQCHGVNGAGMTLSLAPAIAGMDQWYVEAQLKMFRSGARGTNPDDVGGMRMHPMSLWLRKDEDITAVASYVASMAETRPTPTVEGGNIDAGKTFYQTCAACHGAQAEGDQSKNAPALRNTSDWYLVSALEKYKAGVRGGNPANSNAVLMRGMANILPTDQAIKDVVAYIDTLSN